MTKWIAASTWFAASLLACGGAVTPVETKATNAADIDGDGIVDDTDECNSEAEDGLPPFPKDGCKQNPNDLDGDNLAQSDACPNEPETRNGYQDGDGCPDSIPEDVVSITTTELRCDATILFETGQAAIENVSDEVVSRIATALRAHPQIQFLEIAGHADATGDNKTNLTLTQERAQAVVDALVEEGIDEKRLRARGYGSFCPIDDKDADLNRRVEFKILLQNGTETNTPTGCKGAESQGLKPLGVPDSAPRTSPGDA